MIEILGWVFLVIIIIGFIQVAGELILEWTDNGHDLQVYFRVIFNRYRLLNLFCFIMGGWLNVWVEFYGCKYKKKTY